MISTSITRVKINEVVESQVPQAIDSDNPLFGEFLKTYYHSQEFQGGPADIAENLVEYKGLDFLNNENLIGFTSVSSYINGSSKTIYVDSTKGWPEQWGLLKINGEIITYTGIGTTSFTGCSRGFSGIENNKKTNQPEFLTFTKSGIGTHAQGTRVHNLSNVFLQTFLQKLKKQVLPGFSERKLNNNIDQSNFIRQAKDFYRTKGSEEGFKILFGALYNKPVEMIQPAKYMIRPSDAGYITNDILIAKHVKGNPLNIAGQSLFQGNASGSVYGIESSHVGMSTYYNISISEGTILGLFKEKNKTFVTKSAPVNSTVLNVDSTVGFTTSGTFTVDGVDIDYTGKNYTQFTGITVSQLVGTGATCSQGTNAYAYEDGDEQRRVELEITNLINKVDINASSQQSGSDINLKSLGKEQDTLRFTSWIYNTASNYNILNFSQLSPTNWRLNLDTEHSFHTNDELGIIDIDNNVINATIANILSDTDIEVTCSVLDPTKRYFIRRSLLLKNNATADVQNTYSDGQGNVFVASNSLPHWTINPQKRIKSFATAAGNTANPTWIPIVDHNLFDGDLLTYNVETGVKLINLTDEESYYVKRIDQNNIALAYTPENIRSGEFINAFTVSDVHPGTHTLTPSIFHNSDLGAQRLLRKFPTPVDGDSFTETVQGGVGLFVNGVECYSYKATDSIYFGPLDSIEILNSGKDYDVIYPPRIAVYQDGHTGVGASAIAQMKGTLEEILVDTDGVDYLEPPNVAMVGGNNVGSIVKAKIKRLSETREFDATTAGTVVNTKTDRFVFSEPHHFIDGEELIYTTNGTTPIGIGTTPGTLIDGAPYYVVKLNDHEMHISESQSKALAGIGTLPISQNGGGMHQFRTARRRSKVDKVLVEDPGVFYNREVVTIDGVNTYTDSIVIKDHHFISGEVMKYSSSIGAIGGLSNGAEYYCIRIDDDTFRLSNSNKLDTHINFTSVGTGVHTFQDPPIVVEITGRQGVSTYNATATPIIRGEVIAAHVSNKGNEFGSTVINDNFKPEINTVTGSKAFLQPFIINGRVDQVIVKSGGENWFSTPEITILGDGVGATAKAIIDSGRITKIIMIEKGGGYTQAATTASARSPGIDALYSANIRKWTINQVDRYAKFLGVDIDDGYLEVSKDTTKGNPYANYYAPRELQTFLGDDGVKHSPIVGWAYDGNPIYGPSAFKKTDGSGGVDYIKPSYVKVAGQRVDGPNISDFPIGFFCEDYSYQAGYGDLDQHNGRFSVTPEFPNGVYAYYTTLNPAVVSAAGNPFQGFREPLFPYIIGETYKSVPEPLNLDFEFDQRIDPLDYDLVRNTTPYNITKYEFVSRGTKSVSTQARILYASAGSVEELEILDNGREYKVGDNVVFDNTDTDGYGAIGRVRKIFGPQLSSIGVTVYELPNATFQYKGGEVLGISTVPHTLVTGDVVEISNIQNEDYKMIEGKHKVTRVNPAKAGIVTSMQAISGSVGLTTTIQLEDDVNTFKIGDILRIDHEEMEVYDISTKYSTVSLIRARNGTVGVAHTQPNVLSRLQKEFTFELVDEVPNTDEDVSRYFGKDVVGAGISFGTGIGHTITTSEYGSRKIPSRTIFIKDHPFINGEKLYYSSGAQGIGVSMKYQPTGVGTASGWIADLPPEVYASVIDRNLVGIITQLADATDPSKRVMFHDQQNVGMGNTHSLTTNRVGVCTGDLIRYEVTATTLGTHTLEPLDTVEMSVVSTGTSSLAMTYDAGNRFVSIGSSINPVVNVIEGDTVEFDVSDPSLENTKLQFFLDHKFQKSFVGSGVSRPEVIYTNSAGQIDSKVSVRFTPQVPQVLYYKVNSELPTKVVEVDTDIDQYNKIIVNNSIFTGKATISSVTSNTFKYNIFQNTEKVGYTTAVADLSYLLVTGNEGGPIGQIDLISGGLSYKDIPQVTIASTTGSSALLKAKGSSIGVLDNVGLIDIGYDYPTDRTLRPEASVPQVVFLKDNFSVSNVAITSTGSKYLTAPDLVIYNSKTRTENDTTKFDVELSGNAVTQAKIITGGGNLRSGDNALYAVNNTNGVGIVTVTYSAPNVTVTLQTPPDGYTTKVPIPFAVGDRVFVENVGVSTGHGYNSSTYGYEFFTINNVNQATGLVNKATISYEVDEDPGIYDYGQYGSVSNEADVAKFSIDLQEGRFFKGEPLITSNGNKSRVVVGSGKARNVLRVDNVVGFSTGQSITGTISRAGGTIENIETYEGHFETGILYNKAFGWERDTGKLSDFYQRIQDSDYYQSFSYSLKSEVGISSWSEPVDALGHISGFKKHSDLLVPSVASGIGTIMGTGGVSVGVSTEQKSVVLIGSHGSLSNYHNFDLGYEIPDNDNTVSNKVVFNSTRFGDSLLCETNRVLEIDDISPGFYTDPNIERLVEIDAFDMSQATAPSAIKYHAQVVLDSKFGAIYNLVQYCEFVVFHDGTNVYLNQYSDLSDEFDLGYFTVNHIGSLVSVSFSPFNASYTFDITFYKETIPKTSAGIGLTAYANIEKIGITSAFTSSGSPTTSTLYDIDSTKFKSGHVIIVHNKDAGNQKEVEEYNWLADGTSNVLYTDYGNMDSGEQMGDFDIVNNSGTIKLQYTPNANTNVSVKLLQTNVGVATYVTNNVSDIPLIEVGDAELNATRTTIGALGSPSPTTISTKSFGNFTCMKYFIEIHNTTDDTYSCFNIAANAFESRINYNTYNNISTVAGTPADKKRDIRAIDMVASGTNAVLRFEPLPNKAYITRVSEIRIDKPDNVPDDKTVDI